MTQNLFLLRHAKSSWDHPDLPDHDRPLAKRGRKAGVLLRKYFAAQALRPDLALVSSATRAQQTYAALDLRSAPVKTLTALYHASPTALLDIIRAVPETVQNLLIVGHNPGLEALAVLLCEDRWDPLALRMAESFPTGALAQFAVNRPWAEAAMGCAQATGFVTPRQLKV